MARSYRHIQQYEREILELKEKGLTHKEIAQRLGFSKEQVKGFIKRQHKKERKIAAGISLKKKSRPPKDNKSPKLIRLMNSNTSSHARRQRSRLLKWKMNLCGIFSRLQKGSEG